MKPSAFFFRFIIFLTVVAILSACGPVIGNTFSTISNSLPVEAPAAAEAPAEEPPALETQPTQDGIVMPLQPVLIPSLATSAPNTESISVAPTSQPALPEQRRLTLEFPPQIRAGDSDRVRLTLEVDDLGNLAPTAEVAGNVVVGEVVEIPNLYETHSVIAEAQFDITGLQVSPSGTVSQPLAPGQSVTFYWSILPEGVGIYRGTVWLHLRFVDQSTGEERRRAVSASLVEIEAVNFLGFSGSLARSFGVVGSIAGTIIGFPFLEDIVKLFFRRRKPK
jgi:hypothetical protein